MPLARFIFPFYVDFSRGLHVHLSPSIWIAWIAWSTALTFEARILALDLNCATWFCEAFTRVGTER